MTNTNANSQISKASGVNLGETSIEITDLKCQGASALSPIDGNLRPIPAPIPKPDKNSILAALAVLFAPDDVVELRAFAKDANKRVDSGYFDAAHREQLTDEAMKLSVGGAAVYVTLNPVDPQLLSRYCNRVRPYAPATTADKQVTKRRWLLIDLDPARPSGTSATTCQVDAARMKAAKISEHLTDLGWPDPIVADSGNGSHLLYAIDLPNDDLSSDLVKSTLVTLARRFDDDKIKVDRVVHNAARICKLYGTVANKGDHTDFAPWRLSKIVQAPVRQVVTADQLRGLQSGEPTTPGVLVGEKTRQIGAFSLDDFLVRHGLESKSDRHGGRERFKLAACPFNPEHVNGEAAIFRGPSGALGFKCQHDSCATKGWRDVRNLLDGSTPRNVVAVQPFNLNTETLDESPSISGSRSDLIRPVPDVWPETAPLPSVRPPVDAFNADFLPEALRDWVMDIAHRMQCPADFPAVAAIVALSSLIGARAVVRPKVFDDWKVVPNLWGAVVGSAGVKKSPALNQALEPLMRLEAMEFARFKTEHAEWEIKCKLATMQGEANAKKAKSLACDDPAEATRLLQSAAIEMEPTARRFVVNDSTVEKLGELLQQNQWGTLSYRDELIGMLTSMDKQGQEGARAFYLQSYDGNQGYTFDRIGRGTVRIPRLCLAMIGGIQPGKIQEYVHQAVSGGGSDDGLLQRFGLAVWPDMTGEFIHVDEWPDNKAKLTAYAVFERLAALEPESENEPAIWQFDDAAQKLFVRWLVPFEQEIRGEDLHPAMVSHLSKYRKLIPALALVFALIDTPDTGGVIQERELRRALEMGAYLRTHANRLYSVATAPEISGATRLLEKIKRRKLVDREGNPSDRFTPREIAVKGWSRLDQTDAVSKAADLLVDHNFLRKIVVNGGPLGGRPSEQYIINPALLYKDADSRDAPVVRKPGTHL